MTHVFTLQGPPECRCVVCGTEYAGYGGDGQCYCRAHSNYDPTRPVTASDETGWSTRSRIEPQDFSNPRRFNGAVSPWVNQTLSRRAATQPCRPGAMSPWCAPGAFRRPQFLGADPSTAGEHPVGAVAAAVFSFVLLGAVVGAAAYVTRRRPKAT